MLLRLLCQKNEIEMRSVFLFFYSIGFGEFSESFCEVSCLSWIDNDDGEAIASECCNEFSFEFSCGFEYDLLGFDFFESFDERLDSFCGIGYSELFVGRQNV